MMPRMNIIIIVRIIANMVGFGLESQSSHEKSELKMNENIPDENSL